MTAHRAPTPRAHWPGWQHLPREARDTLFLLAVIGWTVLPHLLHLPLWCGLLTAGVLLWRGRLALAHAPLPVWWVRATVLGVAVLLTAWSYKTLLGKEPGVTLAVVLMALKTLELRAQRDAFVVFFLGFFLVLTHFLYSQSLSVAVAMLISVWGLLTALVLAHMPVGKPPLRLAGGLSLRTAAWGAPIMVLLFVLFPRIGPLWGVPQDGQASTGLSNTLSMGSMASVALDERIAMRIKFIDAPPPSSQLYFRGPVLTRFDGQVWTPLHRDFPLPTRQDPLQTQGPGTRYEMTLEPLRLPLLPLLDATAEPPALEGHTARRRDDLSWATLRSVTERLRFTATAHTTYQLGPLLAHPALHSSLQLPPGHNPRTIAWAQALRLKPALQEADASTLAQAVMQHIGRSGYSYTLEPGVYGQANSKAAIDEFWLDRREGFCEHFAASFVVVMRAMQVPARIVTGYQGADPAVVDGYHIVRQSHAHAWAEYWQAGQGWVRADPTAAVAPDRIGISRALLPTPGLMAGALQAVNPRLLTQLRDAWETVNNRWNQWVLSYSRGQQFDLLKKMGFSAPSWEDLALLLIGALSTLSLIGAAWAWWDKHRTDPWQRQASALRHRLRQLGLPALPHTPPLGLAQEVRARFGPQGEPLAALLVALDQQRYGRTPARKPSAAWWREVKTQLQQLRPASRRPAA